MEADDDESENDVPVHWWISKSEFDDSYSQLSGEAALGVVAHDSIICRVPRWDKGMKIPSVTRALIEAELPYWYGYTDVEDAAEDSGMAQPASSSSSNSRQ